MHNLDDCNYLQFIIQLIIDQRNQSKLSPEHMQISFATFIVHKNEDGIEIIQFSARFFRSPTGSKLLEGISKIVNTHFNVSIFFLIANCQKIPAIIENIIQDFYKMLKYLKYTFQ